jgi:hypothetical protein
MEQQTQFGPDPCPTPGSVILRTVDLVLSLFKHCPKFEWFCKYHKRLGLYPVPSLTLRMRETSPRGALIGYLYLHL